MKTRVRKRTKAARQEHEVARITEPVLVPGHMWGFPRWRALVADEVALAALMIVWRAGYQAEAAKVPLHILGHAILIGCYARNFGEIELFDDYDALLDRIDEARLPDHVDKWLLSCVLILHRRKQHPHRDAFDDLGYGDVLENLITVES